MVAKEKNFFIEIISTLKNYISENMMFNIEMAIFVPRNKANKL